ncbi:hypothetical protein J6590_020187 [Homalodisca vitripennis]|nr:hypothetical protein J6590_020187 [Homalodisca vitripennis]
MEDSLVRKAFPGEARLKGRHPENWKKTKEKKQRNQPKMLPSHSSYQEWNSHSVGE